ncbi:hypothetical protein [Ornithinimicrobium cerasi]|uniref:DoxX protein n=1 Tax=Ornithinimicrobium cerasi TaxID=2248773 RepID=A0A285VPY1_9MICO|nr:hypothetical protein [Ornithinimicrobium cerasi]SOC56013.1 hypothetical protein SAMN05421879_106160 [Ornithinimicrobium cerasi]
MHPTHVPIRLATGAYILNSGLNKLKADEQGQEQMHGWASSVYPMFKDMKAGDFTKLLGYGEIGVGALLLLPTVPSAIAGGALAAFGAGLTGMYLKTPGMTESDGVRPTTEGTSLAKDVWLVGAGLTLASQSFLSGTKHAAQAVAGGVSNAAGAVTGGVAGVAGSVASGVTGAVHSGSSGASKGVKGLLESAHDAREELADALADLAESMLKR